jgi:hypothetical protein
MLAIAGDVHEEILPAARASQVLGALDALLRLSLWAQKEAHPKEKTLPNGTYEAVLAR